MAGYVEETFDVLNQAAQEPQETLVVVKPQWNVLRCEKINFNNWYKGNQQSISLRNLKITTYIYDKISGYASSYC